MSHCAWTEGVGKMVIAKNMSRGSVDWLERAGLAGSLACMAHCLALPLLLAALPALASGFSIPESLHLWVLAFAIPAATIALVGGRGRHGANFPLCMGSMGVSLLVIAAIPFAETWAETPLTVAGSLSLAVAHIVNWRLRHACNR